MPAGLTPPPQQQDPGADVTSVPPTTGERVMGGIAGIISGAKGESLDQSPIEKGIRKHQQQRLDEAKMYRRNAATYASVLGTGINPQTGAPLTPDERNQYQNWYDTSWASYEKAAGVSKENKGFLQKGKMLLDHIVKHGASKAAGGASGAGAGGAQPSQPPQPSASAQPPSGGGMTPPPSPMSNSDAASLNAPRVAAQVQGQEEFDDWKRKQGVLHQQKMDEIAAQAAGKPKHQQKTMAKTTDGQTIPVNYDPNTGGYTDQQGNPVDVASLMTTASAAMLPKLAWTMKNGQITSVMRDPKTNQIIEGTENPDILPPSGYMEHIHEGEFSYVDPNGILHRVPTASSSGVKLPQGGKGASGGGTVSLGSRKPQGGGKAPQGGGNGTMSKPPTSRTQATSNSSSGPGRTIGPVANKAIQADAIKASNVARPMVNLLESNEEYMKSGKFTPRGDIGVIVAAVRAMNPGSVRLPQKELEMEVKAGSYGDRLKRYYSVASTGLLPADQRKDLMSIIKRETTKTAENAAANWKEVFRDSQPLPAHLKNYDASSKPKDTDKKPAGKMTTPPKGSPQTSDELIKKYLHGGG